MRLEDGKIGQRVISHSDGFTKGWTGTISSKASRPSHRDVFYVIWDKGPETAVACDLVEPVPLS